MEAWKDYLDRFDDKTKLILISVLELAQKYSVDAVGGMPYGVPGLRLNGKPIIAVAAHKEHYGIYPFSPKVIKAAQPLIGNHETSEGTIRFKYGTFPSEELIKTLVELRSKEIA
jgi:uncharacterized protein YdhG (YjbR/CyaY superfamily)